MRLGEHDTRRTDDGAHLDVLPHRVEPHEDYNSTILLNDIALISMVNFGNTLLKKSFV